MRPHMSLVCREISAIGACDRDSLRYEHMFAFSPPRLPLSSELLAQVRPVSLAKSRTVPLGEPWRSFVPGSALRRGSTVVVEAPVVLVVVGADVVDVAARVVVVTSLGLLGLLLHAASTTAAQATKASAQRGDLTRQNPRAGRSRGTA